MKNKTLELYANFKLPLILLLFLISYSLLLIFTTDVILHSSFITSLDLYISNNLSFIPNTSLFYTFIIITFFGSKDFILPATLIILLFLYKKRYYLISFLLGIFSSGSFVLLAKDFFHRIRPETASYLETSFSFPSGHSTLAVMFYGFIAYMLIKHFNKTIYKRISIAVSLLIILIIGFSRLYLGVHYFSDVIGGYILGGVWLIIAIYFSNWIKEKMK